MSVKVAVRVRPFNEREIKGDSKCCVKMVSNSLINLLFYRKDQLLSSSTMRLEGKSLIPSITPSGVMMISILQKMDT